LSNSIRLACGERRCDDLRIGLPLPLLFVSLVVKTSGELGDGDPYPPADPVDPGDPGSVLSALLLLLHLLLSLLVFTKSGLGGEGRSGGGNDHDW
jgi:hypothetical protein